MEDAIVAALAEEGIAARSRHEEGIDYTGVWVEERKIASIGVHVSRGVTTHGFAVNVDNDLEPFSWVVACGLPDVSNDLASRASPPAPAGRSRRSVADVLSQAHGLQLLSGARAAPAPRLAAAPGHRHRARRQARGHASPIDPTPPRRPRRCRHERHPIAGEPRRHGRAERARPRRAPAARAQAAVVQGAAARRRALPRADRADPLGEPAHGLPGGRLPERGRVLGARARRRS